MTADPPPHDLRPPSSLGERFAEAYAELVARLLASRWYLVDDDEVGGHAVANVDKATSELDLDAGDRLIGDVLHPDLGRHVVALHNAALDVTTGVALDVDGALAPSYLRPAALLDPPTDGCGYLAWLEARVVGTGLPGDVPAVVHDVWHAYATVPDGGGLAWRRERLARHVAPLAGAQLVDGLRARRALTDAEVP